MIVCWAAKGGSGTTVVACALALTSAATRPTLLIDLGGDCPTALGLPEPHGPGIREWLASPTATAADFSRLAVPIRDQACLLPLGTGRTPEDRWARLLEAVEGTNATIVDCGAGPPPSALQDAAQQSLLVTRPCYLALRRAQRCDVRPTGVVLIAEPGRALGSTEVEQALGVPVVAEVQYDPAVARAVDAGLLAARLPRSLQMALRSAA
jgi:hypothetical protein